jgi:predicted nucleic acid-binding protein
VTLILDTAPIVALSDRKDSRRHIVRRLLAKTDERLIVPAPVTAEIGYFLSTRFPPAAAAEFLREVVDGRFQVECLELDEYRTVLQLQQRYANLNPGLADLSVVVLARRYRTRRILTFDERHFRVIDPLQGGRFTILPGDDSDA